MSGYSREAEALARVLWGANTFLARYELAQRAIDAGWVQRDTLIAELEAQGRVPPPDPWEPIARKLYRSLLTMQEWDPQRHAQQADLLDAVRDLLTEDEARAIAARIEEAA